MIDFNSLTIDDEAQRRKNVREISETIKSDPSSASEGFPQMFEVLKSTEDSYVTLQIGSVLSELHKSQPQILNEYKSEIFNILEHTSKKKDETDDSYWGTTKLYLINLLSSDLNSNPQLLQEKKQLLFDLIENDDYIKTSVAGIFTTVGMQNPNALLGFSDNLITYFMQNSPSIGAILPNLYPLEKEVFHNRFDEILQISKTNTTLQSTGLNLLRLMAKDNASKFSQEDISTLGSMLNNPSLGALVAMTFDELKEKRPELLVEIAQQMEQAALTNGNLVYQVAKILGTLGRQLPEKSATIMETLFDFLENANDYQQALVLVEVRNLTDANVDLVDPYLDIVKTYENSNQDMVREQAKSIIDIVEGRTLRDLANKIEQNNKLIAEAASSTEELMEYIDENISMVKEFIAEIVKKLPTPRSFDTEGKIRKTLILNFVCDQEGDRCIFPTDRPFTTETKSWSKWLKVAFSGVKLGKCLILPANIGQAGKAVKEAYDAYKTEDDAEFLKYISQPFLTSSEQDTLVEQLREEKFFDVFSYDAQEAHWLCTMCNL